MTLNKKRILEVSDRNPEATRDKIVALKKEIMQGTYRVKADEIATKMINELFFELLLTSDKPKYRGSSHN